MNNRYLEGIFAPIHQEHTLTDLTVTGTIPDYLDGRYLRNGPNPVGELDPAFYHWFLGDGMVHGIRIREGRAEWYRNRWIRGSATATALGEEPILGERAPGIGANTNVIGHAGRTLALIEAGASSLELGDELDTIGVCDFDGTVPGGYTAHPKRDPVTRELHAVSYSFARGNTVQYTVVGLDGRARRTVDIEVSGMPLMHDFSLTERYVVLYDLPVTFDPAELKELHDAGPLLAATPMPEPARLVLQAIAGRVRIPDPQTASVARDLRLPYRWNPNYPARVGVMPRDGGNTDIRWFEVDPCWVFHPMNAYDDGDTVVLEVVRYPTMFDRDRTGPEEGTPALDRWRIDLTSGAVRLDRLDDRPQEFPRVDERLTGRRHRFGYAAAVSDGVQPTGTLLKHDTLRGTTLARHFGPQKRVGEFVFHPAAPDAPEDDGVLMGFVYDADTDRSSLQLLDAGSLDTVAAVHLPHRVPAGFHGNWVPTE
ncbi:carotenoid oxygenase [Nocardia donostiensis]|uniref:carotenoid oxygenase family protein n=1 Tax=Nocardia donostiensis TaxID=1538463 RepID=UPI0009DA928A|nr:carotenoid oxygenase family protein [Nocardia donostiensis]OQS12973.1 carotenoid oxygenase [Nocardia donostiensis]